MAVLQLTINTNQNWDLGPGSGNAVLRRVANLIQASLAGTAPQPVDWLVASNVSGAKLTRAAAMTVLAGASGSITNTINGAAPIGVTAAGGDTNTALLLKNAINANTQARNLVEARSRVGVIEFNNAVPGVQIFVCGYTFTGVAADPKTPYEFICGVGDSDDSDALATAIAQAPGLSQKLVTVTDGTSQCILALQEDRLPRPSEYLQSSDETTVSAVQISNRAFVVVFAVTPGVVGNGITYAASGTGATAATATTGRLFTGSGSFSPLNAGTGTRVVSSDSNY